MTLQTVLDVPELFESILLELEPTQLFLCQRICKQFRATIEGTPSIKRRLYLALDQAADSLPVEISHVLTTMSQKRYNVEDRQTAYLNTGRNYWRITRCTFTRGGYHGIRPDPKVLNIGVESIENRWPGRRQYKADRATVNTSSAMAAYLTSKAFPLVVTVRFVDAWGEEAAAQLDTKDSTVLQLGELLHQADDVIDAYNEEYADEQDIVCEYCDEDHRVGCCEFAPMESGAPLRNQFATHDRVGAVINHESWLQKCDLESWLTTADMEPEEVGMADTYMSSDSESDSDHGSVDKIEPSASEFDPDMDSDVSAGFMSINEDDITSGENSALESEPSGSVDVSDSDDDSSSLSDHSKAEFKPDKLESVARSSARSTESQQQDVSGVASTARRFSIGTVAKKGTFKVTFSAFREKLSLEKRVKLVAQCGPRFEPLVTPEERLALEFEALRAVLRPLENMAKASQSN
ncbi:hypothetical protein LTR15_012454 [Elasticomyces elasticus]|nr:hypothetical protein LTR15_012454 [Elasticomyces elasticus]